jgi:hypothetical protein
MNKPPSRRASRFGGVVIFLAIIGAATLALAGPLNPPAGPVAPTGKTTQEVFDKVTASEPRIAINATNTPGDANSVFKITQPGSYYLTGSFTGVAGKRGIEITSGNVTIDLRGFTLRGVPGSLDGIASTVPTLKSIVVRDGSLRDWGGDGVDLGTESTIAARVEGVSCFSNDGAGVTVGNYGVVDRCQVDNCDGRGVAGAAACTISRCVVSFSGLACFDLGSNSTISESTAQSGTNGFKLGVGSTARNCISVFNTVSGFEISSGTLTECVATYNDGDGILAGDGCTITRCTAQFNDLSGIRADIGSVISGCAAGFNKQHGIITAGGCLISDSVCRANDLDGIQVSTGCTVRGNSSTSNGADGDGAGIHATGTNNRIEANACNSADRGIDIDSPGNVVIRNTCSGNTVNWDIVAGNAVAQIILASTNAAPIVGNTYGGLLGSTDPNANFTY